MRCAVCGWEAISPAALACGRCGAPPARGSGLAGVSFIASHGELLEAGFQSSRLFPDEASDAPLQPIAWSGYGSTVALLTHTGRTLALEHFRLAGTEKEPGALAEYRRIDLPDVRLEDLVAPPLACRHGTCLVSTSDIRRFMIQDPHLPNQGEAIAWSARDAGERICGAAVSPEGEVFVATVAGEGEGLIVRAADGAPIAAIAGLGVAAGGSVGLSVHRRRGGTAGSGDFVVHAWAAGTLVRQQTGAAPNAAQVFRFDGLEAPALSWAKRVAGDSAIPWYGWRCAAAGVYPVETGSAERPELGGLVIADDEPGLVRYGRGRHQAVVAESARRYLLADSSGLRVVDPRTGHLIAGRDEAVTAESIFSGTSSGSFIALRPQGSGEVVMRGLDVRGGDLVESFRATLRRTSASGRRGTAQPLRAVPGIAPLETDAGLLVCLEEGAGGDTRVRLWHATNLSGSASVS